LNELLNLGEHTGTDPQVRASGKHLHPRLPGDLAVWARRAQLLIACIASVGAYDFEIKRSATLEIECDEKQLCASG